MITQNIIVKIKEITSLLPTPLYLYDEEYLIKKCETLRSMPNAYGLTVRYAMKANSNKAILKIVTENGLKIDASSLNEVRRAVMAGVSCSDITLTSQEAPINTPFYNNLDDLKSFIKQGLKYNVCSLLQLKNIADFASENNIPLSMRVHPGVGSGESASRNTGDHYSCFGVHLSDLETALAFAEEKGVVFDQMHVHIGSGADPQVWRENITRELEILEKYFPQATTVSFGGGLKEARMPDETPADVFDLGEFAKQQITLFYEKTGRKLHMEVEPGTFVIANTGYIVNTIIDKKSTGKDGFNFLLTDGGMDVNTRPAMYGSRHPFYLVSSNGELISSEFEGGKSWESIVVGSCCESGDSQTLAEGGLTVPREMNEPEVGDWLIIGGAGAYCSAMSPFNYNSHTQAPEVLLQRDGSLEIIRKPQTLEQIVINE